MLDYDIIPARKPPADPAKAYHCLILHGLGDSKDGWKPVSAMLGLDQLGYIFAQAPIPYYGGGSWFDLSHDFHPSDAQVRESRAAVQELIGHLLQKFTISSERLFLFGFSQGCLMIMDVGLRSAARFAGMVGISGFFTMLDEYPAAFGAAAKAQDILLTHGLDDPMIPISVTRKQKDRLRQLGLNIDWREYAKEHGVDPADELPEIREWLSKRIK